MTLRSQLYDQRIQIYDLMKEIYDQGHKQKEYTSKSLYLPKTEL